MKLMALSTMVFLMSSFSQFAYALTGTCSGPLKFMSLPSKEVDIEVVGLEVEFIDSDPEHEILKLKVGPQTYTGTTQDSLLYEEPVKFQVSNGDFEIAGTMQGFMSEDWNSAHVEILASAYSSSAEKVGSVSGILSCQK